MCVASELKNTVAEDKNQIMSLKPLTDRILDAEVRASKWLADANAAREAGNEAGAAECDAKSQYWLDRYNLLSGRGDRPAPKH